MSPSARPVVHPARGSFSDSVNRVVISGKVKTLLTPYSHSLALVLPQPPELFCMLEGTSLPRPFFICS